MPAAACRLALHSVLSAKVSVHLRSLYARCQAGKPAVAAYQTSCMPKLRSASAQLQQEVVSPTFPVAADKSMQPKHQAQYQPDPAPEVANKVVRRQRKRPQTDTAVSGGAATPDAALQQTPKKKAKVRKALLSTLWTEEDLIPLRLKVEKLFTQLNELYEDPPCPLKYDSPFQLLVAVILSAQSTDKKVNEITPALFKLAPDAHSMAAQEVAVVQQLIRQIGLAPTKAKNICGMSKMLVEEHKGVVPETFDELEKLPGVGHKTASVVICTAFGVPTFPVDTHIYRLALRWGLTQGKTVEQAEADLKVLLPEDKWNNLHLRFIYFGREHCPAQRHDPTACPICSWAAVPPYNRQVLLKNSSS